MKVMSKDHCVNFDYCNAPINCRVSVTIRLQSKPLARCGRSPAEGNGGLLRALRERHKSLHRASARNGADQDAGGRIFAALQRRGGQRQRD